MRKLLLAIAVLIVSAGIAWAATLGSGYLWGSGNIVVQTQFTDNGTTAIINSSTATTAYSVQPICTRGSVLFEDISATNIMNVAMQTSYRWAEMDTVPSAPPAFFNTVGSTSAPYHQINPSNTDTYKFDFTDRWFNEWRLVCLAGCDLTNTIGTAVGFCGRDIQ